MSKNNFKKRSFSTYKPEQNALQPTTVARQIVGVFVREGKKEKIEKAIRSRVFSKSKTNNTQSFSGTGSKRASIF